MPKSDLCHEEGHANHPTLAACGDSEEEVTALSTAGGTLPLVRFRDTYYRVELCKATYVQDDEGFPITCHAMTLSGDEKRAAGRESKSSPNHQCHH